MRDAAVFFLILALVLMNAPEATSQMLIKNSLQKEYIRITEDGLMGIGTSLPGAKLTVQLPPLPANMNPGENAPAALMAVPADGHILFNTAAGYQAAFLLAGGEYGSAGTGGFLATNVQNSSGTWVEGLRVNQTGVGIGVTNPQTPLHTFGPVRFDGTLGTGSATDLDVLVRRNSDLNVVERILPADIWDGDNYVTGATVSGTTTKTLTLSRASGASLTAMWTDLTGGTATDEKVKGTSTDPTAGYLADKVQNSVRVNTTSHKLELVGDLSTVPVNSYYGMAGAGSARTFHTIPVLSVTGGNGLTGGTTGTVTLAVGAGAGITVNADNVAVNYGTGLNISSSQLVARTGEALWNANKLQDFSISTTDPTSGQILKYNGTAWAPANELWALSGTKMYPINSTYKAAIGTAAAEAISANLAVKGNAAIGTGYFDDTAPANGLLVEGYVTTGTTTQRGRVTVEGHGALYSSPNPGGSNIQVYSGMDVRITSAPSDNSTMGIRANTFIPPDRDVDYFNAGVQGFSLGQAPPLGANVILSSSSAGVSRAFITPINGRPYRYVGSDSRIYRGDIGSLHAASSWDGMAVYGQVLPDVPAEETDNVQAFAGYFVGAKSYFSHPVIIGGSDETDLNGNALHVNGNAYTTGTWGGSDLRFKKNIMPIDNALENVCRLQGVKYEWNKEIFPDRGFSDGTRIGLIAQEVENIIPELVHENGDGYKAVGYDQLGALLIEAVKDLKKSNDALKDRNASLEAKIKEIERQMLNR